MSIINLTPFQASFMLGQLGISQSTGHLLPDTLSIDPHKSLSIYCAKNPDGPRISLTHAKTSGGILFQSTWPNANVVPASETLQKLWKALFEPTDLSPEAANIRSALGITDVFSASALVVGASSTQALAVAPIETSHRVLRRFERPLINHLIHLLYRMGYEEGRNTSADEIRFLMGIVRTLCGQQELEKYFTGYPFNDSARQLISEARHMFDLDSITSRWSFNQMIVQMMYVCLAITGNNEELVSLAIENLRQMTISEVSTAIPKAEYIGDPDASDDHKVLGVSIKASGAEITAAYRAGAKVWAPDKHLADKKEVATTRMKRLNEAYQKLSQKTKSTGSINNKKLAMSLLFPRFLPNRSSCSISEYFRALERALSIETESTQNIIKLLDDLFGPSAIFYQTGQPTQGPYILASSVERHPDEIKQLEERASAGDEGSVAEIMSAARDNQEWAIAYLIKLSERQPYPGIGRLSSCVLTLGDNTPEILKNYIREKLGVRKSPEDERHTDSSRESERSANYWFNQFISPSAQFEIKWLREAVIEAASQENTYFADFLDRLTNGSAYIRLNDIAEQTYYSGVREVIAGVARHGGNWATRRMFEIASKYPTASIWVTEALSQACMTNLQARHLILDKTIDENNPIARKVIFEKALLGVEWALAPIISGSITLRHNSHAPHSSEWDRFINELNSGNSALFPPLLALAHREDATAIATLAGLASQEQDSPIRRKAREAIEEENRKGTYWSTRFHTVETDEGTIYTCVTGHRDIWIGTERRGLEEAFFPLCARRHMMDNFLFYLANTGNEAAQAAIEKALQRRGVVQDIIINHLRGSDEVGNKWQVELLERNAAFITRQLETAHLLSLALSHRRGPPVPTNHPISLFLVTDHLEPV